MALIDAAKKFGLIVQIAWMVFAGIVLLVVGIGYVSSDKDSPAPTEEIVNYDQMYLNCLQSIEGYVDDGGNRYSNAAEACANLGTSNP